MTSRAVTGGTAVQPPLGTLRLLVHVPDRAAAERCATELRAAGWDVHLTTVQKLDPLAKALTAKRFDVVLTAYRFPGWSGLDALEIVRASDADVPVIVVSDTLGDEVVAECLKRGATDFVLRSNLSRLPFAVERARNEALLHRERARTFDALRTSEARYRSLVNFAPLGIFQAAEDGTILAANGEMARILGYDSPDDLVGMDLARQVYAEPAGRPARTIRPSAPAESTGVELMWRRRDGAPIWVQLDSHALADHGPGGEGGARRVEGFVRDITARKAAEEDLRRSERSYRRIVETASEGIWTVDADGRTTYVNQRMCELLGYSVTEMTGRLIGDFVHDDSRTAGERIFGTGTRAAAEHEVRFTRKDGADLWARLATNPIVTDDGAVLGGLAMVTDITARKQLERRFLQAQRMESVGRLAGGVAHDFNNLLSVIIGWTEMAMSELPAGHSARASLEEVLSAGQGAAKLARKLLAFSRQQVIAPTVFNPNTLVADIDDMLRRLIGEDIELTVRADPGLGNVNMDRALLEQVLMNLVVNARDAMPDGGHVGIETANTVLDAEDAARSGDVAAGPWVMIAVTDSGTGMSDEVKSHLFEPFFTTKVRDKGTGLGLSTCHGIVKQAGGHIVVESEVGAGTTLRVYLPRAVEAPAPAPARTRTGTASGAETILLVEDESAVRRVTASILTARGFRVVSTASGEEALRLIEGGSIAPLHLLLTDVVLAGGMSGGTLAERVRALRPDLRVLFISGYADDVGALHDIRVQKAAFLQKPFTGDVLGQKVRDVLDAD